MRTSLILGVAFLVACTLGCGTGSNPGRQLAREAATKATSSARTPLADMTLADTTLADTTLADTEPAGGQADGTDGGNGAIRRKIVYRAALHLVVDEFSGVAGQVEALAERHGGFVANSSVSGATGSTRQGTWTVRVPATSYGTFLQDAQQIGECQTLQSESEEVTVEFYDLDSRIRNRKASEERLLALLGERASDLNDVLKIEQHLSLVREEIERFEGRLRVLGDLTAFCTVTIAVHERVQYAPPEVATFRQRLHLAWTDSLNRLTATGEDLAVTLVAMAPWLAVFMLPLALCILGAWRLLRPRVPKVAG